MQRRLLLTQRKDLRCQGTVVARTLIRAAADPGLPDLFTQRSALTEAQERDHQRTRQRDQVQAASAVPPSAPAPEGLARLMTQLRSLARVAENVGERLPEEARRIHYGETEARDIRGSASADEVESLLEEGILVLPVPPAEEDLH